MKTKEEVDKFIKQRQAEYDNHIKTETSTKQLCSGCGKLVKKPCQTVQQAHNCSNAKNS